MNRGDDVAHVVPINDTRDHIESVDCWCRPRMTEKCTGTAIVHNSADGRERYERGELRPS